MRLKLASQSLVSTMTLDDLCLMLYQVSALDIKVRQFEYSYSQTVTEFLCDVFA